MRWPPVDHLELPGFYEEVNSSGGNNVSRQTQPFDAKSRINANLRATAPVDHILPGVVLTVAAPCAEEMSRPIEFAFVAASAQKFSCENKEKSWSMMLI